MFATPRPLTVLAAALAAALPLLATAQTQVTKPPKATAYIDLATNSSDIPGMGMMAGMARGGQSGGMMGALGGMLGGGGAGGGGASGGNTFGSTHGQGFGAPGKYVDISVGNLKNPGLQEAGQAVVTTFFATPLKLISPPPPEKPLPPGDTEPPVEYEKPKPNAKISVYWGCGDTIRPGQPRTLDMSKSSMEDYTKFFTMRSSNSRGARLRYGEPSWPNKQDDRRVPESAQLAGDHQISGAGMPDNFKFVLDDRQDFLAPIALTQQKQGPGGAVQLEWQMVTYARGYFISVMGGQGGGRRGGGSDSAEMVIWTSSELPEMGYALMDYATNGSIEQWVKDKVVLPPTTTKCTVPKGIFGEDGAGMLRMVAYGGESFLAYPKRPTDPKVPYEPDWQVKVRSKSSLFSMLGGMPGGNERGERGNPNPQQPQQPQQQEAPGVGTLLKGLFGR